MPSQSELFTKHRQHTRLPGEGYPASPGSGPRGETCKSCGNCCGRQLGSGRVYKCRLTAKAWSKSTDIRLDAPACLHWVAGHD